MGTSMGSGYRHPVDTSAGITKGIPDGTSVSRLLQKQPLVWKTCLNNSFYDLRESEEELK